MTYESYIAQREYLLYRKKIAEAAHCRLTAAARQREIDRLDNEYQKMNKD